MMWTRKRRRIYSRFYIRNDVEKAVAGVQASSRGATPATVKTTAPKETSLETATSHPAADRGSAAQPGDGGSPPAAASRISRRFSRMKIAALLSVAPALIVGAGVAHAWGTGVINGPGGCQFAGYSQVNSPTYSWADTGAAPCSDTTGVRIQYWTGSSWTYASWVFGYGTTDYVSTSVGTQYMNGYHKIFAYGQWSGTYWTTAP